MHPNPRIESSGVGLFHLPVEHDLSPIPMIQSADAMRYKCLYGRFPGYSLQGIPECVAMKNVLSEQAARLPEHVLLVYEEGIIFHDCRNPYTKT